MDHVVLVNKGKWGNILQPLGGDSAIKIEKKKKKKKKMNKKKKFSYLPTQKNLETLPETSIFFFFGLTDWLITGKPISAK